MDELPTFDESHEALFHLLEDNDSGVEELPFAAYSTFCDADGAMSLNKSFQLTYFGNHFDNGNFEDGDGDDEEENDLEYIDDEDDDDYMPNKAGMTKKGKNKFRKFRHLRTIDTLGMFTPPKRTETETCSESSTRHYARKDRTPRTIMKMMEKHRESERVRHHTLNESMKEICARVPGYDPNSKETKVIQMQRIIGYECFLENTITNLCENLGLKRKLLGINTNFITEAMKDKKPEDWFKIDHVGGVSMNDDEDSVLDAPMVNSTDKCIRKSKNISRHSMKYRREKISSPTVDSTTSDMVVMFPPGPFALRQSSDSSQDGSWMSQGFRPIQESQESGIKIESQSTIGDTVFHDSIDSLFDQEICGESENLKTATATFMNDDIVPTSTSFDEGNTNYDLSSPPRSNTDKVFLQSPNPKGVWHHPVNLYFSDTTDRPGSREMTSISPEYILETKPKVIVEEINTGSSLMSDSSDSDHQAETDRSRSLENITSETSCIYPQLTDGKNKRKRYTPMRALFKDITNADREEEQEEEDCKHVVKVFKHHIGGNIKEGSKHPLIIISTKKDAKNQSKTLSKENKPKINAVPSCSWSQDSCQTVDYRKTSWMNGFMMFCRLNRCKFICAHPGLHSSHIQKLMGEHWRSMTADAQEPYREKARKYCQHMRKPSSSNTVNDRLVPTSTTDDLEYIIAGL